MPATFTYWYRLLLVIASVSVAVSSAKMPMAFCSEEPEAATVGDPTVLPWMLPDSVPPPLSSIEMPSSTGLVIVLPSLVIVFFELPDGMISTLPPTIGPPGVLDVAADRVAGGLRTESDAAGAAGGGIGLEQEGFANVVRERRPGGESL